MLQKPRFRAPNMLAQNNLTQNQDSKSFKVTRVWSQWKSSETLSNQNVGFNCQGFDFRRHSISERSTNFPLDFKYSADHSLILRLLPITCSDLYLETI